MRLVALAAIGVTTFAATMTFETTNANAVVYCVEGAYRAGCVVRRPVARRAVVRRRSDMMLKHDISLLGHLDNGLGFYRFSYNDSDKVYVGVMAQEVQTVMPAAVVRGSDGYLRVFYDKLGLKFQTYDQWVASGAHIPAGAPVGH
jgi:endosialidase-like protein